ncbi:endoribonuclease MazF [Hydrogenivirga sp. 128-5-R1-1]|uniref:endoribonuclease MazF n=1 Tax=Hydrogenivirga sp. 128-5-R1-1 TaxID=392423 RepID=UPI00015F32D8|nr:endoribonuclease MazF [Hydrogenivirga sp. 128-5-R1-1]EDP74849.1 probable ppGpp-regulated growth inhibitor ChpA/MazF [Hydrogenivirga sp. 128-5-R1-1]
MRSGKYVPDRGDLVWLSFSPQIGHEQAGRRPALCLTPREYNEGTSLGIFVPVTSKVKGYPFEVPVDGGTIKSVILADQVRNIDWRARKAEFAEKCSSQTVRDVIEKPSLLIGMA